jgi:hypothetical protein
VFHFEGATAVGEEESECGGVELIERLAEFFLVFEGHDPAAFEVGLAFGETVGAIRGVGREVAGGGRAFMEVQSSECGLGGEFRVLEMAEDVLVAGHIRQDFQFADAVDSGLEEFAEFG